MVLGHLKGRNSPVTFPNLTDRYSFSQVVLLFDLENDLLLILTTWQRSEMPLPGGGVSAGIIWREKYEKGEEKKGRKEEDKGEQGSQRVK